MSRSHFLAVVLAMVAVVGSCAVAADPITPERKAKAVQNTKLALDLSRQALAEKKYIDAVQMADLADRCAEVTEDAEFMARTMVITKGLRDRCPPEKVEEARKIIQELVGKSQDAKPGQPVKMEAQPPRQKTTEFKIEGGKLVLPGPVIFEAGGAAIAKESEASLFVILDYLDAKPLITTLRIESHLDNSASPERAQAMTEQRALAVAKWLVARGADPKRLLPVGFGSSKPVAPNDTPENKAANRRIDVRMAALRGKAIGGMPLDGGGKVPADWQK